MNPVVLRSVAAKMAPALVLLSLVLLARGHNAPGGGFVGGLLTGSAMIFLLIAYDLAAVRRMLRLSPTHVIASGLLLIVSSGVPALLQGRAFLAGVWTRVVFPWGGDLEVGTPLLFDVGVFVVVLGTTLGLVFALEEGEEGGPKPGPGAAGTSVERGRMR